VRLVERSRLDSRTASYTPISGKRLNGAREVGWTLKVRGSLANTTNLLYLLQDDPQLSRIEHVTWSPVPRSTDVELSLHFLTLVVEPPPGDKPAEIDPKTLVNSADLRSNDRKQYALISDRDLFRPYIRRPTPQVARTNEDDNDNDRRPGPPPPPPLKLVGLPDWGEGPEVNIRNEDSGKLETYSVGEALMGSEIMAVDYRVLQHPRNPLLFSTSRVILRSGRDFFAIEVGDMLAQKHKLTLEQLPPAVRADIEKWMRPAPAPPQQNAAQSERDDDKDEKTTPTIAPQQPDTAAPGAAPPGAPGAPDAPLPSRDEAQKAPDDSAAAAQTSAQKPSESKEIRDAP
jgi:hypothetical protein